MKATDLDIVGPGKCIVKNILSHPLAVFWREIKPFYSFRQCVTFGGSKCHFLFIPSLALNFTMNSVFKLDIQIYTNKEYDRNLHHLLLFNYC